ncbi:hypothetical protein [Haloechinothrix salitolerans]|uniref:Uncharacterized protein n=1 Tax=Haloechinothrix salitolerans TaxID=926830 RepID=A0ABW2BUX0_9PSEU
MGRQTPTTFDHCPLAPLLRRRGPASLALVAALCGIALVLITAGCGPRVEYRQITAAGGPGAGGATPEPTTAAPLPTRHAAPTTTPEAAPNRDKPKGKRAKPRTTRTPRTGGPPLASATIRPDPVAVTPQTKANGRCDWMANFEHGKEGRPANWIILDTGAWGRAEVPGNRIWIAPRTPCDKVYSVAVHEWTHHMQGHVYRDWAEVERELAPYGGPEMVADCGALLLGATWIKYGCPGQFSTDAAAAILRGERPRLRSRR